MKSIAEQLRLGLFSRGCEKYAFAINNYTELVGLGNERDRIEMFESLKIPDSYARAETRLYDEILLKMIYDIESSPSARQLIRQKRKEIEIMSRQHAPA